MTQLARPISDISVGTGWTIVPASPATIWDKLAESLPDGFTSYVWRLFLSNSDSIEVKLSSLTDPVVDTGHVISVNLNQASDPGDVKVALYQGAVQIAIFDDPGTSGVAFATHTFTLSSVQAAAITDYTDLRVRIICAEAFANQFEIDITWIAFEVPDFVPETGWTLNDSYPIMLAMSFASSLAESAFSWLLTSADFTTTALSASGSASGSFGFSGSVTGRKGATSSQIGAIGFAATEVSIKRASGSTLGAIGFKGNVSGAEGVAYGAIGALGMSGSEVGQKRAIGSALGAFGFSGSESGTRRATSSVIGSFGLAASVTGSSVTIVTGSALGAFGFTGSVLGERGAARITDEMSGDILTLLRRKAKAIIRKIIHPLAPQPLHIDGRVRGSFSFTGSVTGEKAITPTPEDHSAAREALRQMLERMEMPRRSGSASARVLNFSGRASGIAAIPLAKPTLLLPADVVPPAPPPPLPDETHPPAVAVVGFAKGAGVSFVGSVSGVAAVPEVEEDEEELMFALDQLLAA